MGIRYAIIGAAVLFGAMACREGGEAPLPPPVELTPIEERTVAEHPSFEPLPGAEAHFGTLNGGTYRYEVPHEWNGRLVMYMHGEHTEYEALDVDLPPVREWFVENGYAWAASSYDRLEFITGIAADQTAALWDYFVQEVGRPERTYVIGRSMGGGGVVISAERYADRYDGAISACGGAGPRARYDLQIELFYAGAYATGLTRERLNELRINGAIYDHIMPGLEEPKARAQFEALWMSLSGGQRPHAIEGFEVVEPAMWWLSLRDIDLADTRDRVYELDDWVGVGSDTFNEYVFRVDESPARAAIPLSEEITGEIRIPLLLLHTTGDGIVPLRHVQHIEEKVEEAGRSELLEVLLVESPYHCGFTDSAYVRSFRLLERMVDERN